MGPWCCSNAREPGEQGPLVATKTARLSGSNVGDMGKTVAHLNTTASLCSHDGTDNSAISSDVSKQGRSPAEDTHKLQLQTERNQAGSELEACLLATQAVGRKHQ